MNKRTEWEEEFNQKVSSEPVTDSEGNDITEKIFSFLKETVEKHGYNKYLEGLEHGQKEGERRGAERAVEFMRNASDHDMGWNDMLEAAKKVAD